MEPQIVSHLHDARSRSCLGSKLSDVIKTIRQWLLHEYVGARANGLQRLVYMMNWRRANEHHVRRHGPECGFQFRVRLNPELFHHRFQPIWIGITRREALDSQLPQVFYVSAPDGTQSNYQRGI